MSVVAIRTTAVGRLFDSLPLGLFEVHSNLPIMSSLQSIRESFGIHPSASVIIYSGDLPREINTDYWFFSPHGDLQSFSIKHPVEPTLRGTTGKLTDVVRFAAMAVLFPWETICCKFSPVRGQLIAEYSRDPEAVELLSLNYADCFFSDLLGRLELTASNWRG